MFNGKIIKKIIKNYCNCFSNPVIFEIWGASHLLDCSLPVIRPLLLKYFQYLVLFCVLLWESGPKLCSRSMLLEHKKSGVMSILLEHEWSEVIFFKSNMLQEHIWVHNAPGTYRKCAPGAYLKCTLLQKHVADMLLEQWTFKKCSRNIFNLEYYHRLFTAAVLA